ncbi:SMI1/KNR4 family protein [Streptomyces caniscabiei]|uniref:SMI1/KNR4 family protein n=1 Tax=Streptomyces caniscabiei TaxID=2746961 RepID=A0A927L7G2_9ACTN|nr:SMI1/KNR4 family protein [Streptomyces caniscabiei]MBD9726438.1 SMI1/KNR4 family protein [Streptomyces caniscabiei]MDX3511706.1 SMI1/KNR4 family protein [Streptomyces caniscabiei]MDX3719255.1 SMI1/KNR4 family protein [Streptomyces caniscabiei]WEO29604.1 SMI1/KNR4 family protein [Streptomyces caniscabiei]
MTPVDGRRFPAALAAALAVPFVYEGGDGIDFEPFETFLSAEETTDWFRAWTANGALDGDAFRVFGQDGTGGYAAFWLIRPGRPLTDQPVVFLGSEGETGVVARDLGDFLWLLAAGYGPWEAATTYEPDRVPRPDPELAAVAERFAPDRRTTAAAVIELAGQEFPDFDDTVMALCR